MNTEFELFKDALYKIYLAGYEITVRKIWDKELPDPSSGVTLDRWKNRHDIDMYMVTAWVLGVKEANMNADLKTRNTVYNTIKNKLEYAGTISFED